MTFCYYCKKLVEDHAGIIVKCYKFCGIACLGSAFDFERLRALYGTHH